MTNDQAVSFSAEREAIGAALGGFCDRYLCTLPSPVSDAIRYSLTGEGKRMRGILFLSAYEPAGGTAG